MRNIHLERLLGKLDDLDSVNLANLVQRLARERRLFEIIANTVHEGIWVVNHKGLIEYSNEAANRIVGIREKDVGTAFFWKFFPELSLRVPLEALSQESPVSFHEVELSYPEHRYIRLYLVPFDVSLDDTVTEGRVAVIFSDVTQEKIATDELLEDQKLSSIFMLAAGVAHELGNPLNSINIHLQLIEREINKLGAKKNLKLKESLQACKSEVHRLDSIIENFLNAIRPTPPDLQEVNIYQLLDEVFSLQAQELQDLNVKVDILFDASLPSIIADPQQVKQVFFNIVKNAMEAMDCGGLLAITTTADDDYLVLHFADNGVGIDEETMGHILEPYYTTKPTGHGLGMMIVQRIMRAHGGQMSMESRRDLGTRITLRFPLKYRRVRMLESTE